MAQLIAVDIPAPHGILDGLLRLPDIAPGAENRPPRVAALVCHPHPKPADGSPGGTMHNKVVFRVAQALGDLGMPTLRFNFRGVGRSSGVYDAGRGEKEDVRAALDALATRYPGAPLLLAGFSFGSWVGLPVGCADPRVSYLVGVGAPVSLLSIAALDGCAKPKLIVQGELDQYGPRAEVEVWYARLPDPKHLTIVPGADHFFTTQQTELYDAVATGVRALMGD